MVELVVRLVFSLAVVIGLMIMLTKFGSKRFRGSADALVRVVHRQPLSRTSAVAVVTVGSRVLVLGTTEQQVQLLTELDPDELDLELEPPTESPDPEQPTADVVPLAQDADGRLAGSALSAQTWKQAYATARGLVSKERNVS